MAHTSSTPRNIKSVGTAMLRLIMKPLDGPSDWPETDVPVFGLLASKCNENYVHCGQFHTGTCTEVLLISEGRCTACMSDRHRLDHYGWI
jgi:hypothetical protein